MVLRSLVIDSAEEGQQLRLQPMNGGAVDVTTGATVVPNVPLGGTYWIDNTKAAGGDGSDELPFNTIAAGIAAIAAQALQVGTLLMAGRPDYTAEGLIAVPDGITLCIFNWRSPSQQPTSFALTAGTGSPLIYLRGCNVELTLGDAIVQADMTSIVATSNTGGSTLVMRGGSARLSSQVCRLSGSWDDAACSLMHVGTIEAALDCVSLSCDACAVEGLTLDAGTVEFRTTSFSTPLVLTATTISMDRQSEKSAALVGVRPSTLPVPLGDINPVFGSGVTGDVVQNVSAILAQAAEYNSLTFGAAGRIRTESTILRVRNLLDLSVAQADAIEDYTGGTGGNAAGSVAGAAWGGVGGYSQGVGGSIQAPSGATGGKGAGAQPTALGTLNACFGGQGGSGGAGGAGDAGAGGAGRSSAGTVTNVRVPVHWPPAIVGPSSVVTGGSLATAPVTVCGGHAGQAGSAGGGSAAGAGSNGGGGGGSGRPGNTQVILARGIRLAATTTAGCISARARNGGNGGNSEGGDAGGGGGGAGSGGGCVLVGYEWIIGEPPAADEINASGGNGGNGGNGTGAGIGGTGGNGGDGGQIVLWNLLTGEKRVFTGAAGTAGNAPAGAAGGAGGAGGACTADL